MASSSEDVTASPNTEMEDGYNEDSRLEIKKKKKPFQKLRKFFRGSSKKRFKAGGDATLKSHSVSALHTQEVEEDDEGGFKRVPVGLAGSRSISEDSIFKPEQMKEQPIGVLHGTAVSMERINSDFQSELFSKLKGRQLTDSDIDDGLPSSPPSTLTTADDILGGGLKSVPAGGKSTSLDSDRSLLSIDGSETEEDLFQSNWKAGVASVATKRLSSSGSQSDGMEVSDLDAVEIRTEKLSNEVAKHRISVKPKSRRASTKTSMRQKEKPTVSQLPEVKEESPTKISVGEASDTITDKKLNVTKISTTISVGNPPIPRSEPKDIPLAKKPRDETDAMRSRSMSPLSTSPLSGSALQDVKLRPRPASGKFDGVDVKTEKVEKSSELANAFNKAKRFSKKYEDEDVKKSVPKDVAVNVSAKEKEEPKFGITLKGVSNVKEDKKTPSEEKKSPVVESKPIVEPVKDTNVVSPSMAGVSFVLKKQPLRPNGARQEMVETKVGGVSSSEKRDTSITKTVTMSGMKESESDISKTMTTSDTAVTPGKVVLTKAPAGSPEKLASPREDYKQKRQLRSKTLPEQPVPKELLDKAKEADAQRTPLRKPGSPPVSMKSWGNDYDNVVIGAKPIQSKRASWAPETTKTGNVSAEPSWISKARQRQAENEKESKNIAKVEVAKTGDKSVTQTSVKIAERALPQTSVATSEKTDASSAKGVSATVTVSEKSNVQPSVKSWTQSYTAKPFDKTNNVSSVKAPGVQSSSITAKPVTEKPLNVQVKSSVSAQSAAKPSSQPASKPTFDKPISASSKETVEKPVSVSAVKSGFDRTGSQKTSTVTAKPAFESKSVTQSSVRPFGSANTNISKEPVTSVSKEPIKSSVTADTKKPFSVETKKTDEKKDIKAPTSGFTARPGTVSEKKTPDAGGVPAWKQKKNSPSQVKIEIIDKADNKTDQTKTPERKVEEKKSVVQAREKTKTETCSDSAANRSSRVLDMVKNFQKLQVT